MGIVQDYDLLSLFSVHGHVFFVYIVNSDLIWGEIYEILEDGREAWKRYNSGLSRMALS
jgi:hypothetical protein